MTLLAKLTQGQITAIIIAAVIAVLIVAVVIMWARLSSIKRERESRSADKVVIKGGVRYSKDSEITTTGGNENVTFQKNDITLKCGQEYVASRKGELLPGKYTVLTNADGITEFNIRLGGFVREYRHGSEIVIGEGESICAVSHTVILR